MTDPDEELSPQHGPTTPEGYIQRTGGEVRTGDDVLTGNDVRTGDEVLTRKDVPSDTESAGSQGRGKSRHTRSESFGHGLRGDDPSDGSGRATVQRPRPARGTRRATGGSASGEADSVGSGTGSDTSSGFGSGSRAENVGRSGVSDGGGSNGTRSEPSITGLRPFAVPETRNEHEDRDEHAEWIKSQRPPHWG